MFDYYQSDIFNANSWLNNKVGRPKSKFHRNDFGATIGGPCNSQGLQRKEQDLLLLFVRRLSVPSNLGRHPANHSAPEMINGDFSNWKLPVGAFPIYDPSTTRSDGKGGFTRDPFPGNVIPQNRLSPLSRAIAKYYPAPNAPGLVRNYVSPGSEPKKRIENAYTTKIDHSFGRKNRLAFTWTKNGEVFSNNYDTDPTNPLNWSALPYPLSGRKYYNGDQYSETSFG